MPVETSRVLSVVNSPSPSSRVWFTFALPFPAFLQLRVAPPTPPVQSAPGYSLSVLGGPLGGKQGPAREKRPRLAGSMFLGVSAVQATKRAMSVVISFGVRRRIVELAEAIQSVLETSYIFIYRLCLLRRARSTLSTLGFTFKTGLYEWQSTVEPVESGAIVLLLMIPDLHSHLACLCEVGRVVCRVH